MSDIWHTSNEKPEQLRYYLEEYDKFSNEVGYLVNKRYGVGNTIDDLTTKRWCYVDDLLALETELERTRKALEIAVDVAKEIDELLSSNRFDVKEVPLLNITQTKISMLLKCINIEQITALEQKD